MKRDEELERLRHETILLRQTLVMKDEQIKRLEHEKRQLSDALQETIQAVNHVREQVKTLKEQIKTLEEQQAKGSHNSHLPPFSDRFRHRTRSTLKPSGKKQGGQPGHQGHRLQQVEQPDEVVVHRVEACQHCHQALEEQPAAVVERRQVIDLPKRWLWVTEHQIEEKRCQSCLQATRATFPRQVSAPAQYRGYENIWECFSPILIRLLSAPTIGCA